MIILFYDNGPNMYMNNARFTVEVLHNHLFILLVSYCIHFPGNNLANAILTISTIFITKPAESSVT